MSAVIDRVIYYSGLTALVGAQHYVLVWRLNTLHLPFFGDDCFALSKVSLFSVQMSFKLQL